MTKRELKEKTDAAVKQTQAALETIYNALDQSQQDRLMKNKTVAAMFDRHGGKGNVLWSR